MIYSLLSPCKCAVSLMSRSPVRLDSPTDMPLTFLITLLAICSQ